MTNSFLKYVLIAACFLLITDTFCPPKPRRSHDTSSSESDDEEDQGAGILAETHEADDDTTIVTDPELQKIIRESRYPAFMTGFINQPKTIRGDAKNPKNVEAARRIINDIYDRDLALLIAHLRKKPSLEASLAKKDRFKTLKDQLIQQIALSDGALEGFDAEGYPPKWKIFLTNTAGQKNSTYAFARGFNVSMKYTDIETAYQNWTKITKMLTIENLALMRGFILRHSLDAIMQGPVDGPEAASKRRKITVLWFRSTWAKDPKILQKIEEERTTAKDESLMTDTAAEPKSTTEPTQNRRGRKSKGAKDATAVQEKESTALTAVAPEILAAEREKEKRDAQERLKRLQEGIETTEEAPTPTRTNPTTTQDARAEKIALKMAADAQKAHEDTLRKAREKEDAKQAKKMLKRAKALGLEEISSTAAHGAPSAAPVFPRAPSPSALPDPMDRESSEDDEPATAAAAPSSAPAVNVKKAKKKREKTKTLRLGAVPATTAHAAPSAPARTIDELGRFVDVPVAETVRLVHIPTPYPVRVLVPGPERIVHVPGQIVHVPIAVPYRVYQPPLPPEPATEPTLSEIIDALRAGETIAREGTLAKLVRAGYDDANHLDAQNGIGSDNAEGTSEGAAPTEPTLPKD